MASIKNPFLILLVTNLLMIITVPIVVLIKFGIQYITSILLFLVDRIIVTRLIGVLMRKLAILENKLK